MANVASSPKTRAASASRPAPVAPELRCSGLLSETVSNAVEAVASGASDPDVATVDVGDVWPSACGAVVGDVDSAEAVPALLVASDGSSMALPAVTV